MKMIKALVLTLIVFIASIDITFAACTAEESNKLNGLAVNVKVSSEKLVGTLDPDDYSTPDGMTDEEAENYVGTYYYFKIYISNLTEDLYIKVYNNVTNETLTYNYSDSDNGSISIDWKKIRKITNFTITVYSSDKTNCPDKKLYTTYVTIPRYNEYSGYELCRGIEEFYLCHEFLSVESEDFENFTQLVNKYREGKINNEGQEVIPDKVENNGFWDYIHNHLGLVIGASISILLIVGLVVVIIVKKQRSKIE